MKIFENSSQENPKHIFDFDPVDIQSIETAIFTNPQLKSLYQPILFAGDLPVVDFGNIDHENQYSNLVDYASMEHPIN